MNLTTVLDIVIGLCFAYFLLALFCSWANEAVAHLLNRRGGFLFDGLREMLRHDGTLTKFVKHPLIESLDRIRDPSGKQRAKVDADEKYKKRMGIFPSYLPAGTVATVLIDVISPKDGQKRFGDVRDNINALPDGKLKEALRTIAQRADNDIEALRKGIEDWYSNTMDRVSGWYKARTQWWLVGFGFIFAMAFNVDTFKIVRELWNDPTARAAVIQAAGGWARTGDSKDGTKKEDPSEQMKRIVEVAKSSALPVGWKDEELATIADASWACVKFDWAGCTGPLKGWNLATLVKLLGLIVTGCAVALGAPFWFELVNKLLDIRAAGKKPKESD